MPRIPAIPIGVPCASVPAPCCTNARHRVLAMCVMALGAGLCGAACREE
jgi:hypothetical protein